MRILFVIILFVLSYSTKAQKDIAVYTLKGSKYVGVLLKQDSDQGAFIVRIQGGSEFSIPFGDISRIEWSVAPKEYNTGKPYFGFGMGTAMNADRSIFQLDLKAGYQFNRKWDAGIGYCTSDIASWYVDVNYYPYHKSFFSAGIFSQVGTVLSPIDYWGYYYYDYIKVRGLYTNQGISFKLSGEKSRSFALNIGYQYITKRETYSYFSGEGMIDVFHLNRYLIQGVFTF
jgi:hypothetical protein